jgi:peptidoglycan hydrolase-like protein with peptidoglycan-binding domain/uncharacterized protein affecting Mg2+/Co2+ transport
METRRRPLVFALTLLVLAALACNASPTPDAATIAAQTVAAVLTGSAAAPTTEATGTPVANAPTDTATFTQAAGDTSTAEPQSKPSDTPGPTNTPGAQGCSDDAQFVADVTVPDNTVFPPGAAFTKTWRIRNSGSCTWVSSYSWAFVTGEAMSGPASLPVVGSVAPGSQYDISVNLTAPTTPGSYKGEWRMKNTNGEFFGTQPFVLIVVAAPTATTTNTSPPADTSTATPTETSTPTQPVALSWPLVKQGDTGANVYAVQYLLRQRGSIINADGIFGPNTANAVKDFQTANNLTADGIVGPDTWPKLIVMVKQGANGDAVRAVQRLLVDKFGYSLTVDGVFGPNTDTAVKGFQTSKSLTVDGIVGPNTWSALVSG